MGSTANGSCAPTEGRADAGTAVDKEVDFANYFCTYAFLYHQKEMLADRVRMNAYFNAVFQNKHHFKGKVVLDVGTGSGILAIWCAQAGARRVYAVEATNMSVHARELAKGNDVGDIVEVIQGSMEEVMLPEKVDVIISEWMGYFLLRESMFDSVICARDRWLKPDGVMYPSHAQMWMAPIRSGLGDQKENDLESAMSDWDNFVEDTESYYGVNMNVLTKQFREEHEKYYLKTSLWCNIHPEQVVGTPVVIKQIDCLTTTVDEIRTVSSKFSSSIYVDRTRLSALAGWFDVHFRGSPHNPALNEIELTTAPSVENSTHWGQQVFLLQPTLRVNKGDVFETSFSMHRSKENHRLLNVDLTYELKPASGNQVPPCSSKYYVE